MKFSDSELRDLAARAMPLDERWRACVVASASEFEIENRVQKWRQVFSVEGDRSFLARRLAFDRLDWEACRALLGSVRLADEQPLPAWAEQLNALVEQYQPHEDVAADTSSPPLVRKSDNITTCDESAVRTDASAPMAVDPNEEPLPFEEVWAPFVRVATNKLRLRAGQGFCNLADEVVCCFQQDLLNNLTHLAALSLGLEFRRYVAKHDPLSAFRRQATDAAPPSRDLYRGFICGLREGALLDFFQAYPVLARLMAVVTDQWVEHVAEFCRRLDKDRPVIATLFNRGTDPGPVVHVKIGLSDSHHCGRTVVIPTFASGLRVVYKPKDLGIDEAYWALIDWLNTRAERAGLPLRTVTVLNRSSHGWVKFVEQQECRDADQLERYYQRVGMLLCLAYVLGATDFHLDNIIAGGEHPVLVDLETMLQPLPRPWDPRLQDSADVRVGEVMHQSVLRTGLLPFWITGVPGKSYDVSGIGAEEIADAGYLNVQWDAINTDAMQLAYRSAGAVQETNRPTLDGQVISAQDHVAEMIDGFVAMYGSLLEAREELLANDGPLTAFRGLSLRYLLRMTKTYGQLAERRLHPEFLRDGADSSIELERLTRDFVAIPADACNPPPWGICNAEQRALERQDIPYFSFMSDSEALLADGQVIVPKFFVRNGLDYVTDRLRKMSDDDLQHQLSFVRASLHARFVDRFSENTSQRSTSNHTVASGLEQLLSQAELISAATKIAEQIRSSAIHGADGSSTWISLAFDPASERMRLLPMTDSLYDGRIGVALFLSALEYITGGAGFRDLALSSLLPLRRSLQQPTPPATGRNMLGAATGLGSQIYTLVRIASWLADDELRDLAVRAVQWFIPKRIALDDSLDVFGGAAGGILGLLALSADDSNSAALGPAVQCGEHLLSKRIVTQTGHRAWPSSWLPQPLTGFSHGAAGIAYALLRLSHAAGEPRFREAAEEAIAFETAIYSPAARNWPDLRIPADAEHAWFMVAWCNGATGIGLGRLGGLTHLDSASIRDDIDHALQTSLSAPTRDVDHLCCGNMGRIDFLLEAGLRLTRPELIDEARKRASAIIRGATERGSYRLYADAPGFSASTSFFQGTAGIGYMMLRLADPERVPCALLWE